MFWIIGAPTQPAYDALQNAYAQNTNLQVIICASLTTYMLKIINNQTTTPPDTYNLPTNFRTHHAGGGARINSTHVHDLPSYRVSQDEISNTLARVFNFAQENGVPFYFACPPRDLRPTYFRQDTDTRDVYADSNPQCDSQGEEQQIRNVELSDLILKNVLIPAFNGEDNLKDVMEKSCKGIGATFAADVLTVGCALVLDDPSCWNDHRLDTPAIVADDGIFQSVPDGKPLHAKGVLPPNSTDISYVHANFCDGGGSFRSFADDGASVGKVRDKLAALVRDVRSDGTRKLWGMSTVFHDARLNDIDDEPAMYLIRSFSCATLEIQNYSLVDVS